MQLVVRHVNAHATGDNRKRMKDKVKINTEGKTRPICKHGSIRGEGKWSGTKCEWF